MAFSFIGVEQNSADDAGFSISVPSGVVDNDLMFMFVTGAFPTGYTPTTPTGWSLLDTIDNGYGLKLWLYYRVANSEPASYSIVAHAYVQQASISAWRDEINTSDPFDTYSNVVYDTDNTIIRAGTVNVSTANSPTIFFGTSWNVTGLSCTAPVSPGIWTEDFDDIGYNNSYGQDAQHIYHTKISSTGATGNIDGTLSSNTPDKAAFVVVLNPNNPISSSNIELPGLEFSSTSYTGSVVIESNSNLSGLEFSSEMEMDVSIIESNLNLPGLEFSSEMETKNNVSSAENELPGLQFSSNIYNGSVITESNLNLPGLEFSSEMETKNPVIESNLNLAGLEFSSEMETKNNVSSSGLNIGGLEFNSYIFVNNPRSRIQDLAGNPVILGTSGQFLGYVETTTAETLSLKMYNFLLQSIRNADATREGTFFVKRLFEGPQIVWQQIHDKIFSIKDLWSITKCPDDALQYLKWIVGWTSELDYITNELDSNTLRRLIAASAPLWRKRGQEETTLDILALVANTRCVIWNWFDYRWILDEAEFGELHQGRDTWVLGDSGNSDYGEYYSTLRIVDDGSLNRDVVKNIVKFMRPIGERIEIAYTDFLDRFLVEDDTSQWKSEYGADMAVREGNAILEDSSQQISVVDVSAALAWTRYIFYCRIKGIGVTGTYGVLFYYVDENNYYKLTLNIDSVTNDYVFSKIEDGVPTTITSGTLDQRILSDIWYGVRIHVDIDGSDNRIRLYMFGEEVFNVLDSSTLENGTIGIFNVVSTIVRLDECELFQLPLETDLVDVNS